MFAVLHIADFALFAVLRTLPDKPLDVPAALFSGDRKKSVVIATTPAARASNVELGMSAPQAIARCSALRIYSIQPAAEVEARAALLAVGLTLSPLIEDTAPGVCTVDLRGADAATDDRAAAAIVKLADFGLPATAGIARTPLLALYAAQSSNLARTLTPSSTVPQALNAPREHLLAEAAVPYPASTASAVHRLVNETAFLAPLALALAEPAPELAGVLRGWGLRTFGDLTALPRDEIIRRFGSEGLSLWQRASGGAPRPLRPYTLPQTFAATLELEDAVETLEPLLFILRRFLERLTLELHASQHAAAELHLALKLEDNTAHARGFRLSEPTADVELLFRTLHTHLESLTTKAAICAVELSLTPVRPLVRQHGLFETGLRDPHGFAETLARVGALVGAERVGTPQLEDTHRPDAVKLIPPPAVVPPPAEPPIHSPVGVPLRRFRPPLPARVEFTDDRPTYLWTEQIRGEISARSTAYPSSGDWWQPDRAWSRTEWDIELVDGGLYRLLQIDEAWFVEGEYD